MVPTAAMTALIMVTSGKKHKNRHARAPAAMGLAASVQA
jgi:hypothetical protein